MKSTFRLFLISFCLLALACKKDKPSDTTPAPAPKETGTINLSIEAYDSLGNKETQAGGVKVLLAPGSYSALSSADGSVSFKDLSYGNYYPSLLKDFYEGAPAALQLNGANVSAKLPLARFSMYKLSNLSGQVFNKDSILVSYFLSKPVPAGSTCKLALISATSAVSPLQFSSVDIINTQAQQVTKQNVARLPNLRNWLAQIKDSAVFYIDLIPVSYGTHYSNLNFKTVLLGRNVATNNNLPLKKNW